MAHGLTVIKRFNYRGNANEEFSNTYFFAGGTTPTSASEWLALWNALTTEERKLYKSNVRISRGYGYDSDSDDRQSVWSIDLTVPPATELIGSGAFTGWLDNPGDVAAWVRWKTSRLTSPGGKPIYLRKYFHAVGSEQSISDDSFNLAQKAAFVAFGAKMRDGSFLGARTLTAPGHTDVLTAHGASQYVTTRTLKRRGKRPNS